MSAVPIPVRSYRRETDATHPPTKEAMSKTLRASRTAVLVLPYGPTRDLNW